MELPLPLLRKYLPPIRDLLFVICLTIALVMPIGVMTILIFIFGMTKGFFPEIVLATLEPFIEEDIWNPIQNGPKQTESGEKSIKRLGSFRLYNDEDNENQPAVDLDDFEFQFKNWTTVVYFIGAAGACLHHASMVLYISLEITGISCSGLKPETCKLLISSIFVLVLLQHLMFTVFPVSIAPIKNFLMVVIIEIIFQCSSISMMGVLTSTSQTTLVFFCQLSHGMMAIRMIADWFLVMRAEESDGPSVLDHVLSKQNTSFVSAFTLRDKISYQKRMTTRRTMRQNLQDLEMTDMPDANFQLNVPAAV